MPVEVSRQTYMGRLQHARLLVDPSIEQVLALCPHLDEADIFVHIFWPEKPCCIALPPVCVRHAMQLAAYIPALHGQPAKLELQNYCGRTWHSYASPETHDLGQINSKFVDRAIAYGHTHWPHNLLADNWEDFQTVHLLDGTAGQPCLVQTLGVALNRRWPELLRSHRGDLTNQWNDAIAVASANPLEASELQGDRGSYHEYFCARCGRALAANGCLRCRQHIPHPRGNHVGCANALPSKLVALLQSNGHQFDLQPTC